MKSSFLNKSFFSLSFLLAAGVAFADPTCPDIHTKSIAMICVENHSDKDVNFSQFPDFSLWPVPAHQIVEMNSAASTIEEGRLIDQENNVLFSGPIPPCSAKFVGNPLKPEFKLVRGCKSKS
jgi:hypothetical protein